MNKKRQLLIFCFIIVSILSSSFLFPQAGRGLARLSGKVTDESGNPVASATITLQFLEREEVIMETKTDKKGKWKIMGLGSGRWRISVSAQGYILYQNTVNVSQLERNPSISTILKKTQEQIMEDAPGISLLEMGNKLFNEKKFEEALAKYQEFLEKNPELYEVHFSLGNCYKEMGDIEQALKEFRLVLEKTVEEDEKHRKIKAKTLAAIGECYLKKEDLESAQNYFKESLELYPEDEILAYNVGEIYFAHQKLDEAIQYYEFAAKIKPEWSDPYYKLGLVFLNKTDFEKAKESLQEFLKLEPDTARSASAKNILDYLEKR